MKRLVFSVVTVALLTSSASAQRKNFENSFRQIARELGIGWGEGYHHRPTSPLVRPEYHRVTTRQQWPVIPAPPCPASRFAPQTYNIPSQTMMPTQAWHPERMENYELFGGEAQAPQTKAEVDKLFTPADQDDSPIERKTPRAEEFRLPQPETPMPASEPIAPSNEPQVTEPASEWLPPAEEMPVPVETKPNRSEIEMVPDPVEAEVQEQDDILGKEVMDDEQYYQEIEELLRESEEMTPATNPSQPKSNDSGQIWRLPPTNLPSVTQPGMKQASPPQSVTPVKTVPAQPENNDANVWW